MTYLDGNLARPLETDYGYPLPSRPDPVRQKEADREARRRALAREEALRREYKAAGRLHARTLFRLFLVFVALSAAVGLSVWRGARITEMTFMNAGLNRQIRELEQQTIILQDRVSGKASLQMAKEEAVARLGMQKASAGQVLVLSALDLKAGPVSFGEDPGLMTDQVCLDLIEAWVLDREGPQT